MRASIVNHPQPVGDWYSFWSSFSAELIKCGLYEVAVIFCVYCVTSSRLRRKCDPSFVLTNELLQNFFLRSFAKDVKKILSKHYSLRLLIISKTVWNLNTSDLCHLQILHQSSSSSFSWSVHHLCQCSMWFLICTIIDSSLSEGRPLLGASVKLVLVPSPNYRPILLTTCHAYHYANIIFHFRVDIKTCSSCWKKHFCRHALK